MSISPVLINGEPSDGRIPVTDSTVLRGDGCFEVIRAYGGKPFELAGHLARLERSAAALGIGLPPREDLESWVHEVASGLGDCAVRMVVSRGPSVPGVDGPPLVVVFAHEWDRGPDAIRLRPVRAPWHSAGAEWDLAGAKVTSYAPNQAATRRSQAEGFDDALLVSTGGVVLEGPTFAVAWVVDGVLETPGLAAGILDSITRRVVLGEARRLGMDVVEGLWPLGRLAAASEMMALSTVREVQAVVGVGDLQIPPGPMTEKLAGAFDSLTG